MSNGKFALATAEQKAEINEVITKKVFGKQKPRKALQNDLDPSALVILTEAFRGCFMIFPAIVIGIMSGIGAAFEIGLKKTLETYGGNP